MNSNEPTALDAQVDNLANQLAAVQPQLDDLAHARIGAALQEMVEAGPPSAVPMQSAPPAKRIYALAFALVAAAAVVALLVFGASEQTTTAPSLAVHDNAISPEPAPPKQVPHLEYQEQELADGTTLRIHDDAEVSVKSLPTGQRLHLAQGTIEVYGSHLERPITIVVNDVEVSFFDAVISASVTRKNLVITLSSGEFSIHRDRNTAPKLVSAPGETSIPIGDSSAKRTRARSKKGTKELPQEPPVTTAKTLYLEAEVLMTQGRSDEGVEKLRTLLSMFPQDHRVDDAQLDIARIAYRQNDFATSRTFLTPLAQRATKNALSQSAHYLLCRVEIQQKALGRDRCIKSFRATYPASHRDEELLRVQIEVAHKRGGCAAAESLLSEFSRLHATSANAGRLAPHLRRCSEPERP